MPTPKKDDPGKPIAKPPQPKAPEPKKDIERDDRPPQRTNYEKDKSDEKIVYGPEID